MNKYQDFVWKKLATRDLLEQLAEEASELAQAALKMIRAVGYSENKTPVTIETAKENLQEEADDTLMMLSLLGLLTDGNPEDKWQNPDNNPKWERWATRLGYQDEAYELRGEMRLP